MPVSPFMVYNRTRDGKRKTAFILFLPGASHMLEIGLVEGFGERREKSLLAFNRLLGVYRK